ncbi:MAG: SRPBCC family protein [Acidobacteriota bacterium]|nr:SRPBCC family protein [Acidobacteriota bacterium]
MASLIAVPPGLALAVFGATHAVYGWWLFIGVPVLMGYVAVILDRRGESHYSSYIGTALMPLGISAVLLLIWKIEGAICLAMAAPLAIPLAILGGYIAFLVRKKRGRTIVSSCLVGLVPFGLTTTQGGPAAQDFRVSTQIVVDAPPAAVWDFVYAFPDLDAPQDLIFRAGVAAPMGSSVAALGVGADRSCKLSTGVMRERITAWDPPRLLRFDVLSTPPAMKELSPYKDLDPPHLHGFYVSKRGEFSLEPMAGNRTLITGTSWYRHGLEPAQYWRLWSDYVIHHVHQRVLEHVKRLAEEQYGAMRLARK